MQPELPAQPPNGQPPADRPWQMYPANPSQGPGGPAYPGQPIPPPTYPAYPQPPAPTYGYPQPPAPTYGYPQPYPGYRPPPPTRAPEGALPAPIAVEAV